MAHTTNKIMKEEYGRLKKILEKIFKPKKEQPRPQLVLQPIRNRPAGPLTESCGQDSAGR
jgi:hypothetical protein